MPLKYNLSDRLHNTDIESTDLTINTFYHKYKMKKYLAKM